jgi:exodeoxyribonuclease VII large subunit
VTAETVKEQTSAEHPWPVRTVARKIADWVHRLGAVWVEGQITQVSARPGTQTAFLTLRDPSADVSMTVTCPMRLVREIEPPLRDGASVVIHAKPTFFLGRGTISLRASEIRAVGIGELLARIERLRRLLDAEGLFARERKRRLPFLPKGIGLITGRASAAEHDVLANAHARWPAARIQVLNTAVQGPSAVPQIRKALSILDTDPDIDVIVIARGERCTAGWTPSAGCSTSFVVVRSWPILSAPSAAAPKTSNCIGNAAVGRSWPRWPPSRPRSRPRGHN